MTTAVLDASAILALLYREPGGEAVTAHLDGALLSTVNLAEILQKIRQHSNAPDAGAGTGSTLESLGVRLQPLLSTQNAAKAAELWTHARHLSLGGRCCLALTAAQPDAFALTADTAWMDLPAALGIEVRCIR